ncbi:hypothetical protein J2W39_006325 [Variovorax paradoxus]|uniref:Uncharacterized protein n=1 Tax=Variovorax paradoxus TaxID=34073 RepID=A0AAW8EQ98_VARPD|nr:hypothetical protein [Variovorax paradoxus]
MLRTPKKAPAANIPNPIAKVYMVFNSKVPPRGLPNLLFLVLDSAHLTVC